MQHWKVNFRYSALQLTMYIFCLGSKILYFRFICRWIQRSEESDNILHMFLEDIHLFDKKTREILKHLQRPSKQGKTIPEISSEITEEELHKLLKKTKENTESSPSGIHIGHYYLTAPQIA